MKLRFPLCILAFILSAQSWAGRLPAGLILLSKRAHAAPYPLQAVAIPEALETERPPLPDNHARILLRTANGLLYTVDLRTAGQEGGWYSTWCTPPVLDSVGTSLIDFWT